MLVFTIYSSALYGQTLEDHHLKYLPRTNAEQQRIDKVLTLPGDFQKAQRFEKNSGGAATVPMIDGEMVFKLPSANIGEKALDFTLGEAMFDKLWVSSPSSTKASDGLGPLYNTRACRACHKGSGRGHAPEGPEDTAHSFVMRLGQADGSPDPIYGGQLQDFSVAGVPSEGRIETHWHEVQAHLSDQVITLRRPEFQIKDLAYGPLAPDTQLSPRVAQQMIGLGLLESIPTADILAWADPEDTDGNGISGRANVVVSREFDAPMLGRFGLKAEQPTVREQVAAAFLGDIGISTPLFQAGAGDCTAAQAACLAAPHGDGDVRTFEVDDTGLDLTTLYSRNLAVPARRDVEAPDVLAGKALFHQLGCQSCHRPAYVTHRMPNRPAHSFQLIWPYTDLLLHDMGPGLADPGQDSTEWRTPPLWGVGLTRQVSGHTQFLHDGRARSLEEAVLWHGGEGQAARDGFAALPAPDRALLIQFLESL
jgi:CxxC motif-containing protein (DUF1111 family)